MTIPSPLRRPPLYLIGLGAGGLTDLTYEAYEVLRACRTVFVQDIPTAMFGGLCRDIRPVTQGDRGRRPRPAQALVAEVLEAARREPPVGWIAFGHPLLYNDLARRLLAASRTEGLPTTVIPGISPASTVLSQLGIPLEVGVGLHILSVPYLLRVPPDTTSYVLIFRPFDDPLQWRKAAKGLSRFYPAGHRIALVRSPSGQAARARWLALRSIPPGGQRPDPYVTLVIPPRSRQVQLLDAVGQSPPGGVP